jgi:hypothetical protein
MIMPPSGGPHIRDPPQDRDGGRRGGISRDAAFFDREFHSTHRGGSPAVALHRAPARGLAQCRRLLAARQLPPTRDQSGDVPDRRAPTIAQSQDYGHRRPLARALATPSSRHRLTVGHRHVDVSGSGQAACARVSRHRAPRGEHVRDAPGLTLTFNRATLARLTRRSISDPCDAQRGIAGRAR